MWGTSTCSSDIRISQYDVASTFRRLHLEGRRKAESYVTGERLAIFEPVNTYIFINTHILYQRQRVFSW